MILVKKKTFKALLFYLFGCFLCIPLHAGAQGNLMVYPKRLTFEGAKRFQTLSLSNNGNDTARYVISFVQIRMKEDGQFVTITQPDSAQNFADQNLRFFPRSVILGPKESQTVKIQLIKSNQLDTGEYRSHLYFRAEEEKKPLGTKENKQKLAGISIRVTPIFGISIPVMIKVGESTAKVSISNPSFQVSETQPSIKFKANRTGNMSVYGDITVNHISSNGKITGVGKIQGIAIYSPTPARYFQIALNKDFKYNTGKLNVVFSTPAPTSKILAQADILL